MSILFTGSNGFLGKNVIPHLSKDDKLYSLDLYNANFNCNLSNQIPDFKDVEFNVVFHAAGKAHTIPKNLEEEKLFFDINENGTKNLCLALEKNKVPDTFIFISTVAVYGLSVGENISENFPLHGETPYAKSKINAEFFLKNWCEKNNVKLVILRPSLISGENPPGNLGDMINGIKSGKYLNIGKGNAKKSVFFVNDFAYIINNVSRISAGVYNVCDSHHPTFLELSEKISNLLGKSKPISIPFFVAKLLAFIGDFLGDKAPINTLKLSKITKSLTFSNDKIRKELEWEPSDVLNNFKF
ncbi:UDP-galactose-4-epimerase [Cloacibacterium rupense]|uniref:UDP-galactose-4-epimerase n=1 Tax=Cloacibacterium rupense TaxID=517423 RepID=A0ABQ2NMF5_9FLAO|nr:NAD-dependent epimerase/dehydratase family protein [Cloacibacterium rupense]GGP06532.1 UDP-galactose-4-epimerase [Cloacibacterium rupense]